MRDLVPVRLRECRCPGTPHAEGDFAYLKPKVDVDLGLAAHNAISMGRSELDARVQLGRAYLLYGIDHWDLLDADGHALPVLQGLDELEWDEVEAAAAKADDLYADAILRPLVARRVAMTNGNGRTPTSSPSGSTDSSTSAKTVSSRPRRRRS